MTLIPKSSRIHRLRTAALTRDAAALRVRLERALSAVDLEPAGLPSDAVLCVRRLPEPRSGQLLRTIGQPGELNVWSAVVRDTLGALMRGAEHPHHGRVSPQAEAVLFSGEAELLACLALAQAEHRYLEQWWWPDLLGPAWREHAWTERWRQSAAAVPSALALLARGGHLPAVLAPLSPPAVRNLAEAVVTVFGLAAVARVLRDLPLAPPAAAVPPASAPMAGAAAAGPAPAPATISVPAPRSFPAGEELTVAEVLGAVPEIAAYPWNGETRVLLALGLLLVRRPAFVRAPVFARIAHALLTCPPAAEPGPGLLSPRELSGLGVRPAAPLSGNEPAPVARLLPRPPPPRPPPPRTPSAHAIPILDRTIIDTTAGHDRESADFAAPPVPDAETPRTAERTGTNYGGVFYLLNVALHLGLYGDFTQPLRPGLTLSPWDFLTLLGQRLLGPADAGDPVWSLFARLAGRRDDEPPGANWTPPVDWRWPADSRSAPFAPAPGSLISLERWLDALTPLIVTRLEQALGRDAAFMLTETAQVVVTDERVNVHFSLATHPIEVRVAGLDRDPGWVPAAGRTVMFFYD